MPSRAPQSVTSKVIRDRHSLFDSLVLAVSCFLKLESLSHYRIIMFQTFQCIHLASRSATCWRSAWTTGTRRVSILRSRCACFPTFKVSLWSPYIPHAWYPQNTLYLTASMCFSWSFQIFNFSSRLSILTSSKPWCWLPCAPCSLSWEFEAGVRWRVSTKGSCLVLVLQTHTRHVDISHKLTVSV